ncbi:MAG: alkaline shock response membrane anchor protein AmaP [Candidatus Abyssobacteria bacterium SURF_5]|uniref:Alkaline shock response membrane anchor protein AmaP n=1 Tax=Abyssobacteria bacterium (strain SURF_5) TaxID=2093360 RepID=A0A3A4P7U6_ABYX5|nr:MAG: alkaline shock response membrane anchor protein AmaP [Candidatus Abyssubacteria bacterium SURF_5]
MSFIKSCISLLFCIVFFLGAVLLLLAGLMALNEQFTAMLIHSITRIDMPWLFIAGGGVLFLLSLFLYWLAGRGSVPPATLTLEGEKGPISISLRAIEDYLNKHLQEQRLAGNVKTRVTTLKNKNQLVIRAGISAWSEQNLKSVGDSVQREIAARLSEGLGLDNLERVVVSVDKIIRSKTSRSTVPEPSDDPLSHKKWTNDAGQTNHPLP